MHRVLLAISLIIVTIVPLADVQLKSYPALNHLFIAGSGPSSPAEYNQPAHVEETVIRDIAAWIRR